ncbi:CBS domain-containing protein [Amycolatopsis sp. NPDC051903]|uniref:CBS domain-containing protein n=1 Tax=Amycolatopsis sp. NPDC051903 TaxID=3363936 RepID=UPI00378DC05F
MEILYLRAGLFSNRLTGIDTARSADICSGSREGKRMLARAIMHTGATCVGEHETLYTAAQHMRDLDVGALPICGDDDRLHGIITDRDIVIKCIATGGDPRTTTAGQLAQGVPYLVRTDAPIEDVLDVMEKHQVRRVPVLDDHRLVGMISEADLARHLPEHTVGRFVEAICATTAGATPAESAE